MSVHDDLAADVRAMLPRRGQPGEHFEAAHAALDELQAEVERLTQERDEARGAAEAEAQLVNEEHARAEAAEAEVEVWKRIVNVELTPRMEAAETALAERDDYSRKTGCDCHEAKRASGLMYGSDGQIIGEKSMSDREFLGPLFDSGPEYSPAYQDEYRRLWHRDSAALADARRALEQIVWQFDADHDEEHAAYYFVDIARRALAATDSGTYQGAGGLSCEHGLHWGTCPACQKQIRENEVL